MSSLIENSLIVKQPSESGAFAPSAETISLQRAEYLNWGCTRQLGIEVKMKGPSLGSERGGESFYQESSVDYFGLRIRRLRFGNHFDFIREILRGKMIKTVLLMFKLQKHQVQGRTELGMVWSEIETFGNSGKIRAGISGSTAPLRELIRA
ncbi:hypothetical protein AVEN_182198-1 [Araneus ventricosus]|uniref:Uncharacterized protein n=1 Tax=Araneus ventricosus TaxID=182803 RepID=A0A4Y2E2R5_ARAVE|nr:hypothetical protein AVEN_182198-1 [Araneus ventricosus]